jgi:hypothetical protein
MQQNDRMEDAEIVEVQLDDHMEDPELVEDADDGLVPEAVAIDDLDHGPSPGIDTATPWDTDQESSTPLPVATPRSSRIVDQPILPIKVKPTRVSQPSAPLPTWRSLWEESNQRYISDNEVTQLARGSNEPSMTRLLLDPIPEESYTTVPYEPDPRFQKKVLQRPSVVDPRPVDLSTMVWEL